MAQDSEMTQILKRISSFDVDSDFEDKATKEELSYLFNQLIMSDDPLGKEFFGRFMDEIATILDDMKIIAKEEQPDETPEPAPEEETSEETSTEEEVPAEDEEEGGAEIPSEMLGAGYAYVQTMIEHANQFMYE